MDKVKTYGIFSGIVLGIAINIWLKRYILKEQPFAEDFS